MNLNIKGMADNGNVRELQKLNDTIKDLAKVLSKTNTLIEKQNTKADVLASAILELKTTLKGNPSE